jgi:hypothetical protein
MALGAAGGRVEPQNHPEQGHGIHPVLPSLRRGGHPPHGPGIRVIQMSYGLPWPDCLGGYQDRLLGGPLGLLGLCHTAPDGVRRKDYGGEVLG